METRVSARLSAADGRRFGLTLGVAFVALGGVCWWRGLGIAAAVTFVLGGTLLLTGVAVPTRLGPAQRAWLALAAAMSRVTTPIFLGVVYFGVITPIGLLLRLGGRNPLMRYRRPTTCWVARPETARSRRDMERQF